MDGYRDHNTMKICRTCKKEKETFYKEIFGNTNSEVVWEKFKFIDLPGFHQTIDPVCQDWNYYHFLAKKKC